MKNILAADIGFTATGMVIFQFDKEWRIFDMKCLHTEQGHTDRVKRKNGKTKKVRMSSVAHDDISRTEYLTCGIMNYFIDNRCSAIVAEIPHGGAQSAVSAKCMGAATAMIATVRVALDCPACWVTPDDSRLAAGWDKTKHKDLSLKERKAELKRFIMNAMGKKYPSIAGLKMKDKEHIADACAAFEAARNRQIVKSLEGEV